MANKLVTMLVVLLAAGTAWAAPALPRLEAIKVSPHVYYFRGEAGMASQQNRGFMSNAGFVVTPAGVLVFDALATPALGAAMRDAIRKVTPQPIKTIIVSHYHADHFYGLQALRAPGVSVWAHRNARATLQSDFTQSRLAERRSSLASWVDQDTRLVPADRWLDFGAEKALRFKLGGMRFAVIDAGGAHSPEDLMLLVEDERVLFAGDLFFTGRLPFVGEADSKAWLLALDKINAGRPRVVIPGHGAASTDPVADLELTRGYLVFLREQMGRAVAEMTAFDEAYKAVDWSTFEKVPAFNEANRLNAYGTYLLMERESFAKP
ncbi:MBL fold metallo-hydrolase [Massilia cavernae]|uniref:MBL fold metallo-hydrolase n=1 Tax=Massilia cavernae TaxID=2320864 RepID=A0A418Y192_9BURK|nr:MBL fold metallo-hydrolase [Massilia cavernae]